MTDMLCSVAEMQNWSTRVNEELTVEVPASVVVDHHQQLQLHQLSRRTWDFNHDLSQTADTRVTLNALCTV